MDEGVNKKHFRILIISDDISHIQEKADSFRSENPDSEIEAYVFCEDFSPDAAGLVMEFDPITRSFLHEEKDFYLRVKIGDVILNTSNLKKAYDAVFIDGKYAEKLDDDMFLR